MMTMKVVYKPHENRSSQILVIDVAVAKILCFVPEE